MTKEEIALQANIEGYNTKEKVKKNSEVFTPPFLIEEMLDKLPIDIWTDPNKTWLDPCAGLANFSVIILKRLMIGLESWESDEELRRKHILENMLYHVEMNPESADKIKLILDPENKYQLNIKCADFLKLEFDTKNKQKELW